MLVKEKGKLYHLWSCSQMYSIVCFNYSIVTPSFPVSSSSRIAGGTLSCIISNEKLSSLCTITKGEYFIAPNDWPMSNVCRLHWLFQILSALGIPNHWLQLNNLFYMTSNSRYSGYWDRTVTCTSGHWPACPGYNSPRIGLRTGQNLHLERLLSVSAKKNSKAYLDLFCFINHFVKL